MILLFAIALMVAPLDARFTNSPISHLSDSHRLKCDALPYRTAFVGTRCYFAVTEEIKLEAASAKCSSIFYGSKVSINAPNTVFNAMMLDKFKFHTDSSKSSFKLSTPKQAICIYDIKYTCDQGDPSPVFPGKCIVRSEQKKSFTNAVKYCNRRGMEVPAIGNDLENRMIRGALGSDLAWIHNIYQGETNRKWNRTSSFGRFSTCDRPRPGRANLWSGQQMGHVCGWRMSSLIDKTTYMANDGQDAPYDVLCVNNAENDFTIGRSPCIPFHKLNDETGLCDWTGPKDACIQMIDYTNKTYSVLLPNFPKETYIHYNLYPHSPMNDVVSEAIVRRGCMFTGYMHDISHGGGGNEWIMEGNNNSIYGVHNVPSYYTGEVGSAPEGITRVACYCDPTEATLNDHDPKEADDEAPKPKKQKCIEHHVYNETTQACEWKKDPKFCGELISNDGRRQLIEIPDWPNNRKYDVNHWDDLKKRDENFHVTITEVIVRQHCWATLLQGAINSRQLLPTVGYGRHSVISHYTGKLGAPHDGTHRIICECLPDKQSEATPEEKPVKEKSCFANHKFDEKTGLCEWTGPKDACVRLDDYQNTTFFILLPDFPTVTFIHKLIGPTPLNDVITYAVVRRGCMFNGWMHEFHHGDGHNEKILEGNVIVPYGEYDVPSKYNKKIGHAPDGLTRVGCYCDPTEATLNDHAPKPSLKKKCIEHHVFNETTQACEWIHDPKFCGELISNDGRRQMIEIPNWPSNRKYDVNHWDDLAKREENFHVTITEVIVRQHCWATLLQGAINSRQLLPTTGYGKHTVISHYNVQLGAPHDGTHRIICECIR